jgi:hypothetical protein
MTRQRLQELRRLPDHLPPCLLQRLVRPPPWVSGTGRTCQQPLLLLLLPLLLQLWGLLSVVRAAAKGYSLDLCRLLPRRHLLPLQ